MPIKRTHRDFQKKYLQANSDLTILDLGCSPHTYAKEANHYADITDHSALFQSIGKPFTLIQPDGPLPFADQSFDYVILSHVLEHVPDVAAFIQELQRIAKAGYIELPTKLCDNLVMGCDHTDMGEHGHKWWLEFDDVEQRLLYTEKVDAIEKFITIGQASKLKKYFDDSLNLQLHWENDIPIARRAPFHVERKIGFLTLVRKYFSKKCRVLNAHLKDCIR